MSAPKTLVIGGTGPTGPHILQGLLDRGHDVTMLHRGAHEPPDLPDVRHLHADPHFPETLAEAVGDAEWDVVVATYGRMKVTGEYFAGRTGQLVCVGGVPVYRGFIEPQGSRPWGMKVNAREDSPMADTAEVPAKFAMQILNAERSVLARAADGAYRASYVRYPQIYGPRNIVPWEWAVLKRIQDDRPYMILPDDGLWLFFRAAARNAAAAIMAIVDQPDLANGESYNVADDDQFSMRQWAETVAQICGAELDFIGIPSLIAPSAMNEFLAPASRPHMTVDASKIRTQLGYRDVITAYDALAETVAWLRENPPTPEAYPMYTGKFDYDLEDRQVAAYARAVEACLAEAPDQAPPLAHPMPHPKVPSLTVDERGR
ncbi:NAD(P)H-binding protein [Nocardioides humi]|uniref:Nucleoside-diphosphate-sugar epimerase n=1 Tax=Nocardioides humi TaxID=449461 RepID=A0ABN2AJ27_9ACTN|nr:NAD(P)H-binding protein [Nocardioides humi]